MKKKCSLLIWCFYCYHLIVLFDNTIVLIFWTCILKTADFKEEYNLALLDLSSLRSSDGLCFWVVLVLYQHGEY